MVDGLKSDDLCYRQNCFYGLFPKEAPLLRVKIGDYFYTIHTTTKPSEMTQIFRELVEKTFSNPRCIGEKDKEKLITEYTNLRSAELSQSDECSVIFESIFQQGAEKGLSREDLEIAIRNYMQFEANIYIDTPLCYLDRAIREITNEKIMREKQAILAQKPAQQACFPPLTSIQNMLRRGYNAIH